MAIVATFILEALLGTVAPAAPQAVEASTLPRDVRLRTDAGIIVAQPYTLVAGSIGLQPTVLEAPINQLVTFSNSDSQTRNLTLNFEGVGGGKTIFVPAARVSMGLSASSAAGAGDRKNVQIRAMGLTESITLQPGQKVQRGWPDLGSVRVTDADSPSLVSVISIVPPPLAQGGSVSGRVLDYSSKAPVPGAKVKALGTSYEGVANNEGYYNLPIPPGEYNVSVFRDGYTFANRKVAVTNYASTRLETIELVPIDSRADAITAGGGTASNSKGNTNIVFSDGALAKTEAIRLTHLPTNEFTSDYSALPGPFTDGEIPLGFVSFGPDGTHFNGPVVWTIEYTGTLPVGYGTQPGDDFYCLYWIEAEAKWGEPVPAEVVDLGDGKKGLRATLPHFSSYGFRAPPQDGPRPPGGPGPSGGSGGGSGSSGGPGSPSASPDNPNAPCPNNNPSMGSAICLISGELGQSTGTLGLPSAGGLPTQITARYHSTDLSPRIVISTAFFLQPGSSTPASTEWWYRIAGREFHGFGMDVDIEWDGTDASGVPLPPGATVGTLSTLWNFITSAGGSIYRKDVQYASQVRRPDLSPFGLGWFSPHDTLLIDRGKTVSIFLGDGRQAAYALVGGSYVAPDGDFSSLTKNPDGSWTRAFRDGSSQQFNGDGRLTRISDRYGNFQTLTYESNGKTIPPGSWGLTTRIKRVADTSGNFFDYAYDTNGWLASITDSTGRVYGYEHDSAGRMAAAIDPLGQRETYTYDSRGMMTSHTDKRGSTTSYVLDDEGRVVSRAWPTGTTLTMAYSGKEVTMTTDRGTPIRTVLDSVFNPIARYNGVYTVTTTYNNDLLPETVNPTPSTTLYDGNGNVIAVLAATAAKIEHGGRFDQVSRSTTSDGNDTRFNYDAGGNLTSFIDVLGQQYSMTYNASGQPLTSIDPLGNATTLTYDARGQVTSVTDPLGRLTQLTYDAAGRMTKIRDAAGQDTTMAYDALNRLTAMTNALGGQTKFDYDPNGNLTKLTDASSRGITYAYDSLNRRTSATQADGGAESYQYDPNGNISRLTDARGRTIDWTYDAADRPASKAVQGGPNVSYGYNTADRLTSRNDGALSMSVAYLQDTGTLPSTIQQTATGMPLNATNDYAYGDRAFSPPAPIPAIATRPAGATVNVTTDVNSNTVWTNGNVYRILGTINVAPGVILTIQPGAVVKGRINFPGAKLNVQGTLLAQGTPALPIVFTSDEDDTQGGDSNGNGGATTPSVNDWQGISFANGSTGRFDYAQFSWGGTGATSQGNNGPNVFLRVDSADVTLDNSLFHNINTAAVSYDTGLARVRTTNFISTTIGVYLYNLPAAGRTEVLSNTFRMRGNSASGPKAGQLIFSTNPTTDILIQGNLSSGEGNGFFVRGPMAGNAVFDNGPDLPVVNYCDTPSSFTHVSVASGSTLSFKPGTVIKGYGACPITVSGTLLVEGTASAPIAFTSYADDSWGGDTNGDGATDPVSTAPGRAGSISFAAGSTGRLSHVTFDNGGSGINAAGSESAYITTRGALSIGHSTFRNPYEQEIIVNQGSLVVTYTNFLRHPTSAFYAIRAEAGTSVSAPNNYWDSLDGPRDPLTVTTATGSGNAYAGPVQFMPYSRAFLVPSGALLLGTRLASNSNAVQQERYTYDSLGRMILRRAGGYSAYRVDYAYDAADRLTARRPSAGSVPTQTFSYDAAGQLKTAAVTTTLGLNVRETYAYDLNGNLTQVVSTRDGTTNYTYDALNRLTSANGPGLAASYGYDAAGNRTTAGGVTFTYDVGGRMTSASNGTTYSYDAAGNLTSKTVGTTTTYTWDSQGRLTRIDYPGGAFSAYTYDDDGRRTSKRMPDGTTTYFVYDGANLMQELNALGVVIASYTYDGLDRPVSMWRGGQTYFYVLDRLGSVIAIVNSAGAAMNTYRYDPWGNLIASSGSVSNRILFTGREFDSESGLYFYRARYYDPAAGRFIGRDPIGIEGGANLYAYVENNPTRDRDPSGLACQGFWERQQERRQITADILYGPRIGPFTLAGITGGLATGSALNRAGPLGLTIRAGVSAAGAAKAAETGARAAAARAAAAGTIRLGAAAAGGVTLTNLLLTMSALEVGIQIGSGLGALVDMATDSECGCQGPGTAPHDGY